jgi:hypothetical protein
MSDADRERHAEAVRRVKREIMDKVYEIEAEDRAVEVARALDATDELAKLQAAVFEHMTIEYSKMHTNLGSRVADLEAEVARLRRKLDGS